MTRLPLVLLTTMSLSAPTFAEVPLSDDAVAAAIRAGEARKFKQLISDCTATVGFGAALSAGIAGGIQPTGSFTVIVSRNEGRIAFMAAQGKRLYQPLTIDAVTPEMREPAVFVTVEPQDPSRSGNVYHVAAPIERVVLKSKVDESVVAQPLAFDTEPVEWRNLLGGSVSANRAVARFSVDDVREMPAGEFDVVVITTAGERRCKVGRGDRRRLFP